LLAVALYDALLRPGERFVDEATGVRIGLEAGEAGGFRLEAVGAGMR